ncbi:MAG: RNA polymerase sigma factor [Chloroflexota bacterium]|nr:MAG: RNA polymerase sigma factor [Chloroflexota bacterium]
MSAPTFQRASSQTTGTVSVEELMRQYYAPICRLTFSILGDGDDSEDAAQETFVRAALHQDSYRAEAGQKTWLYSIALNVCRGELRKRRARRSLQQALGVAQLMRNLGPTPEEIALQNEGQECLRQAVEALDEIHRLPVILRYAHDLTVPEIAAVLDTCEGTIHSRLHYAREKLACTLGAELPEPPDPNRPGEEVTR